MVASKSPTGPAAAMFAADRASSDLGMELLDVGEGTATVRMTVARSMLNGHLIAHGGYLFMLADTAFACACNSRGQVTVAAGADISFVAPAAEGDVLVAVAVERASYGRSGIYDVTVRRGGDVVAEFRGRSRAAGRLAREGRPGGSPGGGRPGG
ncbi:MAG TPA: hydroxyphenylacetyl-CoA thioesterase PaaI [Streptosporangiaceae bacterium]|nr:hydroxyphenylacetyl-CoA thioesterase PaaI [Streptosporangiaceae bacterium]